jgi:tRNA-dihydrouridine synthase B
MNHKEFEKTLCSTHLLLPPLSGYTDYPYRQILAHFSPPFIITEMVNARAIIEGNKKTQLMIQMEKGSYYKGSQLVGNNPDEMCDAALILEKKGFDYIDINMGCTVKKVIAKKQGVALMRDESLAKTIVQSVSETVHIPVTVKLRTGFSENNKNVLSLSRKLEQAGANAITVHGRSGEKKFGHNIDYDIITKVAETLSIPVIANGGINGNNAFKIFKKTGVSAVMPGRSIIGNPWIIQEIFHSFNQSTFQGPLLDKKKNIALEHVRNLCRFYGDISGILKCRKIIPKYFSKTVNSANLKNDIRQVTSFVQLKRLIDNISERNGISVYH